MTEHDDVMLSIAGQIGDDQLVGLVLASIATGEHLGLEDLESSGMQHVARLVVGEDVEVLVARIEGHHVAIAVRVDVSDRQFVRDASIILASP